MVVWLDHARVGHRWAFTPKTPSRKDGVFLCASAGDPGSATGRQQARCMGRYDTLHPARAGSPRAAQAEMRSAWEAGRESLAVGRACPRGSTPAERPGGKNWRIPLAGRATQVPMAGELRRCQCMPIAMHHRPPHLLRNAPPHRHIVVARPLKVAPTSDRSAMTQRPWVPACAGKTRVSKSGLRDLWQMRSRCPFPLPLD